jgi:cysteinyl-tRNA synthetase, unknown class
LKTVPPFLIIIFSTAAFTLFGCAGVPSSKECTDTADPAGDTYSEATPAGSSWLYQLQNADPGEIAGTGYDILVIDYSRNGSEEGRYTAEEMETLKTRSSGPPRTLLSYLSIGEAEDYRFYFDPSWTGGIANQPSDEAPCWLGRTNPEWKGNYKVQYWSESWQQIVLDYLDRIIDDGFDGVYLDIIDAYEYWADEDNGEGFTIAEEEAALRMINLVKRIAYHSRITRGITDFLIVPQNGEGILDYDTGDYLSTINGIGIEDLYYWETDAINDATTAYRKEYINGITAAGKTALVVDYVDDGSGSAENSARINDFTARAEADGYIPFAAAADRKLASIP